MMADVAWASRECDRRRRESRKKAAQAADVVLQATAMADHSDGRQQAAADGGGNSSRWRAVAGDHGEVVAALTSDWDGRWLVRRALGGGGWHGGVSRTWLSSWDLSSIPLYS